MKKYRGLVRLVLILFLPLLLCQGLRTYMLVRPPGSFPLRLKWQVDLGRSTYEGPAYQDGLVLFPASGLVRSYWYALEATTGHILWSQEIPRNNLRRCLTPEYLVLSNPQSLFTLQTKSGKVIWQDKRGDAASCSELTVFTVVARGFVQAQDLATGKYRWRGTTPPQYVLGLVYNHEADELIAGGAMTVQPETGYVIHFFDPLFLVYPPFDRVDKPIFVVNKGQLFLGGTVRDAQTGTIIHEEHNYSTVFPPTVTPDTMFLASSSIVAFDRTNYTIKWVYNPRSNFEWLSPYPLSPIAILDGRGYIILSDATLRAFDLQSGQEVGYWQLGLWELLKWPVCTIPPTFNCVGQSATVGLTASDDTLFVSFGDGKLYAFGRE